MHDRTDAPSRKRARSRYPEVRALCCECGNLRRSSTYATIGEPHQDVIEFFARYGELAPRWTVDRKCAVCQRRTKHALLRDDLAPEERAGDLTLSQRISPIVTRLIDEFKALGVHIWWEPDGWHEGQVACVRQWLDDNCWHVELNSNAHVVHIAAALEAAWSLVITTGRDIGGDGWRSVAGNPDDPDHPPCRYRVIGL